MALDAQTASIAKDKAEDLFSKGKFQEALAAYDRIKSYGAKDPRINIRMGDIARKMGDNATSVEHYKEAVAHFVKLGFVIKAVAVCKIIISIDPSQQGIQDKLAGLYAGTPGGEAAKPPAPSTAKAAPAPQAAPTPQAAPAPQAALKLPRVPLFSDFTEPEFLEVVKKVRSKDYKAGSYLFREGDEGNSIFIISDGAVEVAGKARDGSNIVLATLTEGAIFGEFGFFSRSRRKTGVRVVADATILELTKADLDDIITRHKRVSDVLFKFYKERIVDRLMGLSDIFRPMTKEDREEILKRLTLAKFVKGNYVVKEGELGDTMFLIKNGKVSVWVKDKSGKPFTIKELGEGDFFGEIALATSRPRVANVTAIEETELVVFSRPMIKDILLKYPAVKEALERIIKERVVNTAKARERQDAALI
ncbi:MAG: cyclic nucleotide-binding domain-containing protein [Deltaproteobacteria bacterium]|nr:cyclic nucleotide-binding domain-containing protein [Deltaproteobacteria bacterium]